jgi:MoxR-like ATPase
VIKGQDSIKDLLTVAVEDDLPTLLVGETGTGKTSLVRELAEEQKKIYTRFSITGETTVDDFVGKYVLKDGNTIWQDGILLSAVKKGHYLVVDEINAALPEILFVLHSLLDDDKYVIVPQKDNSKVSPHKDFRFFATMNPVDEYAGTKELNKAFHSRFAMVISVDYPARDVEIKVLMERTGVVAKEAQKMVDVAVGIRRAKKEEKLFYTLSTRDLIYWGKLVSRLGLHPAFRVAIKNKGTGDEATIEKLYQQVFSDYKRAEENKLETSIEWYEKEYKKLEASKADLRGAVEADVKADLKKEFDRNRKEKEQLLQMEKMLKDQIRQGLKGRSLSERSKSKGLQAVGNITGITGA